MFLSGSRGRNEETTEVQNKTTAQLQRSSSCGRQKDKKTRIWIAALFSSLFLAQDKHLNLRRQGALFHTIIPPCIIWIIKTVTSPWLHLVTTMKKGRKCDNIIYCKMAFYLKKILKGHSITKKTCTVNCQLKTHLLNSCSQLKSHSSFYQTHYTAPQDDSNQ